MQPGLIDQLIVASVALVATILATPLVRQLALRAGALKVPGERHIHSRPIPELGGLAILGGLLAGVAVATRLDSFDPLFRETSEPEAILLAALIITWIGVIDDTRQLSPAAKLAGQVVAAGVLVIFGVTLRYIYIPFLGGSLVSLSPDAAALVTIVAVVAMINAVNLADGLDGLAAGLVAIAAAALFAYTELGADELVTFDVDAAAAGLILACMVGGCVGFLVFNFNPASIFMGDTGAMLLGLLLASAGVSALGSTAQPTSEDFFTASVPALIPALVLAVPFLDTVLAVIRRTRSGQSIAVGDKKHLHHRLLELGHSQRRAVVVLYTASALLSFAVVGPSLVSRVTVVVVVVVGGVLLAGYLTLAHLRTRREERAIAAAENVRPHSRGDGGRRPYGHLPDH